TLEVPFSSFGGVSTVDTGNLVQWRILVEGWQGTAENTDLSGSFYIDDIRITIPEAAAPRLSAYRENGVVKLKMERLTAGKSYEVRTCSSPVQPQWTIATVINATSDAHSWTVDNAANQRAAFYYLEEKAATP